MAAKRASKKRPVGTAAEGDGTADGGADGAGAESVGFDEGLERLEALVGELENGDLSLEESIARYTAGVALLKDCHEALASHRRRVEELTRDAERTLERFEHDPDFEDGDGDGATSS